MEEKKHVLKNGVKAIGITLVVVACMKWILPMVLPFFVAYYLAGVFHRQKEKKREHRIFSWLGVALLLLTICLLIFFLSRELVALWKELQPWLSQEKSGIELKKWVETIAEKLTGGRENRVSVGDGFVGIAVCLVATFLCVADYERITEKIKENAFGQVVVALGKDLSVVGGDYLKAQGCLLLLMMGISALALGIVKIPYALSIGCLIGLCDALPFVGAALIYVPWSLFCFFQGQIGKGIYFLVLAGGLSLLRQYLEPKWIGQRVGANPLVILISIYIGMQVYGLGGVILGPASLFLIWEIYRFS